MIGTKVRLRGQVNNENYGVIHVMGRELQKWIPFLSKDVKVLYNRNLVDWDNFNPERIWEHCLYEVRM